MGTTGEMDDRVDAGQGFLPVSRGKVADNNRAGVLAVSTAHAHGRDIGHADCRQMPAKGMANESMRAGDEYLATNLRRHSHFQPCLLKKRAALRTKYPTWRGPFPVAPPPWWTILTLGTYALRVTRLRRTLQSKSSK
jgi:hypothetical protein